MKCVVLPLVTHATFQYVLHAILSPYLDRFVLGYVDDVLLYSKYYEELYWSI